MKRIVYLWILSGMLLHGCVNKGSTGGSNTVPQSSELKPPRRGEVLFLGNESKHHDSGKYAPWLAIALFKKGVNLTYTTTPNDLNPENLRNYDGVIIYANHDEITPAQETALKEFVESGNGLIPLHSAAGSFRNSDWYISTTGGAFKSHGTGVFTGKITNPSHPVMQGLSEFETWDETYVHQKINPDMTVLMERVEGNTREPYTWVRDQGKGRVFYTAYGHNDSTWTKPGFLKLVTNGVLWAIGDDVRGQIARLNIPDVDIYPEEIFDYTKRHEVPKMQEALAPGESQKLIQTPVDFEMQLFAAEPDIVNPIAMAWDERGRLWIVEATDYPNNFRETDKAANDRIKILEDTNGDGKADKFTVFAEGLNIATSLVFANGGVIVSQPPHFLFMKDTNGDDKADTQETIITGWGKHDTHAGPSNLKYGFDNKVWGVLGYSGFNGTVDGKQLSFPQGVYNFRPDGKEFEFLAPTSNNTWGLGFSEDNNVFISTANNTHSAYYSLPAKYMQRKLPDLTAQATNTAQGTNTAELTPRNVQAVEKIDGHYEAHPLTPNLRQVDVVGGYTSAAGHNLYTARNFPKEYWNRIAFVNEPTVRLVHKAIIEPKGSGFAEKDGWNFLASSDEWFGPVHAEVGPDGAVWVADWYNFIIQHNVFVERQAPSLMVIPFTEQPHGQGNAFESQLRDKNHGRIYRIVYKNAKPYTPVKLAKGDTQSLLAALKNDNMFWRMTAQRLLVEAQDQAAIPGLYALINDQKVDEIGLNSPAVHALWTLHGLGALKGTNAEALQMAIKALSHPAAGVRKAAVAVLPKDQRASVEALQKSNVLNDPNLNVRLTALKEMAAYPASEELGRMVYEASLKKENVNDEWLPKALLAAAAAHDKGFLAAADQNPAAADASPELNLNRRLVTAVKNEVYPLGRRGGLQFPPDVTGRVIKVKGSVVKETDKELQGLIMAHGGRENGYGVFIQDGKLKMVVRQNGKTYQAASTKPLPEKFDFVAQMTETGAMSIQVDGKQVGKGKAPALFKKPLNQNLRTGRDVENEHRMGNYEGDFAFVGNFQNATLELEKPAVKASASQPKGKATAVKAPAAQAPKSNIINIEVVKDVLQFDKKQITVQAGQKVTIVLENPDGMQHNLVVIQPGTLDKVGAAADLLARDPKGAELNYVPRIPEVLHATKLLNTGESFTLEFTAPSVPGEYPYVCTFPGHWRGMNGIMKVVEGPKAAAP
jgi:putative membrane-bound dehydrogenase-like protein